MGALDFFTEPDDTLKIDEETYQIDMSLINVLKFLYLNSDKEVPDYYKVVQGLFLLLKDDLGHLETEERIDVYNSLMEYINGKPVLNYDLKGNVIPTKYVEPVTDILEDFDYIYAGFIQTYNIDLFENRKMDWRKFKALLNSLPKGTKYREVINIRQMDEKGLDREGKARLREAKQQLALKGGR